MLDLEPTIVLVLKFFDTLQCIIRTVPTWNLDILAYLSAVALLFLWAYDSGNRQQWNARKDCRLFKAESLEVAWSAFGISLPIVGVLKLLHSRGI